MHSLFEDRVHAQRVHVLLSNVLNCQKWQVGVNLLVAKSHNDRAAVGGLP